MNRTSPRFSLMTLLCAASVLAVTPTVSRATSGTWISASTGTWSGTQNWAAGIIADGIGDTADFTTLNIPNTRTITIDTISRTLGTLNLGDTDGSNGYSIAASGGATLTFNNGTSASQINQVSASGANSITAPVVLAGSLNINNASAASLTFSTGGITAGSSGTKVITNQGGGSGGIVSTGVIGDGSGVLGVVQNSASSSMALNAANTFSGGVTIKSGLLSTTNSSGLGSGIITLGNTGGNANATLLGLSANPTSIAIANPITVAAGSTGALTLGSGNTGGTTFSGPITLRNNLVLATGSSGGLTLSGTINGAGTITNAGAGTGSSTISGVLGAGVTGITQNSTSSTLILAGSNSDFAGSVNVFSGSLALQGLASLNVNNTVSVNLGAVLDRGAGGTSTNQYIAIGGLNDGVSGGGIVTRGASGSRGFILGGSGTYNFSGVIQDLNAANIFPLVKSGAGTQILSGANTYTGATTITGGTLALDFSAATAPVSSIISGSSALTMAGGRLSLIGKASTSNTQTFAGLALNSGASSIALNANVTSNPVLLTLGAITRSAGGTVDFTLPAGTQSASNGILTSTTTMMNGVLATAAANGIAYATVGGTTWATLSGSNIVGLSSYSTGTPNYLAANNVDVTNGDSLVVTSTVNTLRFNSPTTALTTTGTINVLSGGILVTSSATNASISGGTLRATGGNNLVIINNGGLTVNSVIANNSTNTLTASGSGVTTLNGVNTYTGATTINGGILSTSLLANGGVASGIGASGTAATSLILNGGTLRYTGGAVSTDRNYTIAGNGGAFDASGTGALTISGAPTFLSSAIYTAGNATLTLTGTSTALNTLSGTIGNGANVTTTSLTKNGNGKWVLTAANTYTGPTTVNAGTLLINGTGASAITVNGGVLGGSGTTGASVSIGNAGTLAPGNSPGMLNMGDLSLTGTGATLALEISGTGAGTYDQVSVAGAVNLDGNGKIELSLLSFTPTANDLFFVILNDGSDAISGTLFNLAQGATFVSGGQTWQVSYLGNSATNSFTGGNDLALMAIPEPQTWLLATLGLMFLMSRSARVRQRAVAVR